MTPGSAARRGSSKQAGLNDNPNATKTTKVSDNKSVRDEFASNGNSSDHVFAMYLEAVTQ
jgi:hypothetical protein